MALYVTSLVCSSLLLVVLFSVMGKMFLAGSTLTILFGV